MAVDIPGPAGEIEQAAASEKSQQDRPTAKLMLERTRSQFRVVCESTQPKGKMFKFTQDDPDSETQAKERAEA